MGRITTWHHFPAGAPGQMFWYHYNFKGDVTGLTKQNGQSTHNYRYDPYGGVVPALGNFTDPHNHYTLTGKEWDEKTELVYFGARHYDPGAGVWVTQDTYRGTPRNPKSLHRMSYVEGNPANLLDAYGYLAIGDHLEDVWNAGTAFVEAASREALTSYYEADLFVRQTTLQVLGAVTDSPNRQPVYELFLSTLEGGRRYDIQVLENLNRNSGLFDSLLSINWDCALAPIDQWAWKYIPSTIGFKPPGWGSLGLDLIIPIGASPFGAGIGTEAEHMFVFNWRTLQAGWLAGYSAKGKAGLGAGVDANTSGGFTFFYGNSSLEDLAGGDWQAGLEGDIGLGPHLGASLEMTAQTADDGWTIFVDPISKRPVVSLGASIEAGVGADIEAAGYLSTPSANDSGVFLLSPSIFGEGQGIWTDPQYRQDLTPDTLPSWLVNVIGTSQD
jgi:RHS repeat-associated protein